MKLKKQSFEAVTEFEKKIAEFYGAPYGVAVDSCTHGIELCLRYTKVDNITCPTRCYPSVPMLANKLNINLNWADIEWENYYWLSPNIIDAAVYWKQNSFIPHNYMCLSFQFQKHLSLGRGGMILTDNKEAARILKKMSYDGREPGIPWRQQNIDIMGYHYYMTPEVAQDGLNKLQKAIDTEPKIWTIDDYPDISKFKVFERI